MRCQSAHKYTNANTNTNTDKEIQIHKYKLLVKLEMQSQCKEQINREMSGQQAQLEGFGQRAKVMADS